MRRLVGLCLLVAVPAMGGRAMTVVEASGSIARAVAAAEDGAVITIAPGHYAVNLVLEKSVTLRGEGGEVVFDGGGRTSVVRLGHEGLHVTLEHVTLTRGAGQGAALASDGESTLALRDVTVRGNHAGHAATLHVAGGTLLLESCSVDGNDGDFGGALLVDANTRAILRRTTFKENRVTSSVVAVRDLARLVLEHSTITVQGAPIAVEMRGMPGRMPELVAIDSTISNAGATAISNGPRLPGRVRLERTTVEGATTGDIERK